MTGENIDRTRTGYELLHVKKGDSKLLNNEQINHDNMVKTNSLFSPGPRRIRNTPQGTH